MMTLEAERQNVSEVDALCSETLLENEYDGNSINDNICPKILLRRRNSEPTDRLSIQGVSCSGLGNIIESQEHTIEDNGPFLQRRAIQRAASNSKVQYAMIRAAISEDSRLELQTLLRRKDVKVNEIEGDGLAAIHYAAMHGTRKTTEILINEGAKINFTSSQGEYPLDIAVRTGNFDVAQYLIEKGARLDNVIDGTPLECERRPRLTKGRRAYTINMPT